LIYELDAVGVRLYNLTAKRLGHIFDTDVLAESMNLQPGIRNRSIIGCDKAGAAGLEFEREGAILRMNNPSKVKKFAAVSLCMVLFAMVTVCASMGGDVPRISIQELKKMMDSRTAVTIIDAQPRDVYAEGHIKGAISIPWKPQIAMEDVFSLSSEIPIVTYCDCGPGESDSADVARQLMEMGYDDVKVLKDPSIQGWKKAGYPMEK